MTDGIVLLRNGRIYSPVDPSATAMLVVDDRVAWVGREPAAERHVDAAHEIVDLGSALVTPAFVDAHVHTTETGLAIDGVDLTGCHSLTECLDRVAARRSARPGRPIFAHGWDEKDWPERRPPSQAEVDRAAGPEIAYLTRVDVHSAVVSSALLDRAPEIRSLPGYEPTGLVRRDAHHVARSMAREQISPGQRRDLQLLALEQAASAGIGCIHEMAAPHIAGRADLAALQALVATQPGTEVRFYWGELGTVHEAADLGVLGAAGDLCIDGSLGSRSARLSEPYLDAPKERGFLYIEQEAATQHMIAASKAGIQAGFHVIGDAAVRVAVAAICQAAAVCGAATVTAARHRLEHVEMIAPELIGQLARFGVVASVQPRFDALWGGDGGMYAERLGRQRSAGMNPFAAMVRAGVTLAFGSDSPVTPLAPWETVRAAAHHHVADHRISVAEAFAAHTTGGWRATREDGTGVLAAGRPASYAIWDVPGDLLSRRPDEQSGERPSGAGTADSALPDLSDEQPLPRCLRTVARGRTIFRVDS